MKVRPLDLRTSRPVVLYGLIVLVYAVLMGWWVYFFATQGDRLLLRLGAAGVALDERARAAVHAAADASMRMFLFEGAFLGLLVLGSIWLVMRALRQQMLLNLKQHEFLSAVTHELRTPVASARLYLESILLGRTDEQRTSRYLLHAKEDLDRLASRVDDILLARRLSEDRLTLDAEVVDAAEVAEQATRRLALVHSAQGHRLVLTAEPDQWVAADRSALEQVLDNLVGNAAKYGGEGGEIEIAVRGRGGHVELSVRDHGAGLRGQDPKELVAPFVRGHAEDVRRRPGVGLGLYIVSELVRAHHGRLRIEDGLPGGGACFTVELPRPRRGERRRADAAPAPGAELPLAAGREATP